MKIHSPPRRTLPKGKPVKETMHSHLLPLAPIQSGRQTVLRGDCLEWLPRLPEASVDICVTSPPYNLGIEYRTYDDRRLDYHDWLDTVWQEVHRVLKPHGSFFLNLGASNRDGVTSLRQGLKAAERFVLQNHIIWVKSIHVNDRTHGHFKPINSKRYLNHTWENLFHFTKDGDVPLERLAVGVPFQDKSNIERFGHKTDRRCAGNVWFIPYDTIQDRARDRGSHPATFPVELARRCIQLHGKKRSTVVLDPFLGTGTTMIAARDLAVTGVGIELDSTYADIAESRLGIHASHETTSESVRVPG